MSSDSGPLAMVPLQRVLGMLPRRGTRGRGGRLGAVPTPSAHYIPFFVVITITPQRPRFP
jgi:hypothetical protein